MKRPDMNTPLNFTEKYKSRISLIVSVITLLVLCLFLGQMDKILIQAPQKAKEEQAKKEQEQQELAQAEPDIYTASFLAVGDNRFSNALISSGYNEETDSYDFDPVYSQIKSEISAADFAIVNQETVFTENSDSYSGEDTFASPTAVGNALVAAGFDGIASATNHMDDFGSSMITETLNFWNTSYSNVKLLGIHASETDAGSITIVDINQIKIALLDYTSSSYTNQLGEEEAYMIDQLDQNKVGTDIAAAKADSDCVIVIANWGEEESTQVTEEQKQWTNYLLSQGVLVTIGMNPREVQPYETVTDASGNSMLVYYGLGNFVSTQSMIPRLLEGMARFTIEKSVPKDTTQPATVRISASSLDPMVMHYNYDDNTYEVYMLSNYTDELAAAHSIHDMTEDEFTVSSLQSLFQERTGYTVLANTQASADEGSSDNTSGNANGTDDASNDGESGTPYTDNNDANWEDTDYTEDENASGDGNEEDSTDGTTIGSGPSSQEEEDSNTDNSDEDLEDLG